MKHMSQRQPVAAMQIPGPYGKGTMWLADLDLAPSKIKGAELGVFAAKHIKRGIGIRKGGEIMVG